MIFQRHLGGYKSINAFVFLPLMCQKLLIPARKVKEDTIKSKGKKRERNETLW